MNENSKVCSPIKNRSSSFIGNTKNISSCKPLFSQEDLQPNISDTNTNLNANNKSSLNTLIALLNKKTPSTASQEHQDIPQTFNYKNEVSAFSLEEIKNAKKTSIIYGNVKRLNNQSIVTSSHLNMNNTLNNSINDNNNNESCTNNTNQNDISSTTSEQRNITTNKSYSFIGNTNISLIPEKVFLLPKYSINNKYSKNVLEFSYQEDQNITFKQTMEDKAKTITSFNSNPHNILFTLFDGHGGDSVSSYLQMNYDKFLRQSMNLYPNNISQSLIDSFIQIDHTLQGMNCIRSGSTGCVLFITQEKGKKVLYCANIGDTRCTLFTPSKIERLSYDHRACDLNERERIYNKGGFVVKGRVMGRLMLSRTFGDFELKNFGVISEPFVYRKELDDNEHNDQFVVMACDGIWDVLNEEGIRQCIVNICNDKENLKKNVTSTICDELIQSALAEGAWDNLSVLTVKL